MGDCARGVGQQEAGTWTSGPLIGQVASRRPLAAGTTNLTNQQKTPGTLGLENRYAIPTSADPLRRSETIDRHTSSHPSAQRVRSGQRSHFLKPFPLTSKKVVHTKVPTVAITQPL